MSEFFLNFEVDSDERFDLAKFLNYEDGFDPLTSSFLQNLKALPVKGYYSIQSEEGRPDLVSTRIYGDSNLWWVVLFYNNLLESEELVVGTTVSYPSLERLEDFLFSLRAKGIAAGV